MHFYDCEYQGIVLLGLHDYNQQLLVNSHVGGVSLFFGHVSGILGVHVCCKFQHFHLLAFNYHYIRLMLLLSVRLAGVTTMQ